jgi:hypothetical protein
MTDDSNADNRTYLVAQRMCHDAKEFWRRGRGRLDVLLSPVNMDYQDEQEFMEGFVYGVEDGILSLGSTLSANEMPDIFWDYYEAIKHDPVGIQAYGEFVAEILREKVPEICEPGYPLDDFYRGDVLGHLLTTFLILTTALGSPMLFEQLKGEIPDLMIVAALRARTFMRLKPGDR